jgi:hypothetical protein
MNSSGPGGAVYAPGGSALNCFLVGAEGLIPQPQAITGGTTDLGVVPVSGLVYLFGAVTQVYSTHFVSPKKLVLAAKGTAVSARSPFTADPTGRYAYSAGEDGQVQAFRIGTDGSLTPFEAATAQGQCKSIAISR